jgi:hypothetical protein
MAEPSDTRTDTGNGVKTQNIGNAARNAVSLSQGRSWRTIFSGLHGKTPKISRYPNQKFEVALHFSALIRTWAPGTVGPASSTHAVFGFCTK